MPKGKACGTASKWFDSTASLPPPAYKVFQRGRVEFYSGESTRRIYKVIKII